MFVSRVETQNGLASTPPRPLTSRHLRYIDCTRGYAVLMVVACHLTKVFPGLPWPVRRLMMSGWFGVQLFFLASCLTLLMSWHSERDRRGQVDVWAFFLRRFMRIAPAYYLAGLLYFVTDRPDGGFDALQALASAVFVNAWQPHWISVAHDWIVVPGGWSIGVEFTFYAVFPILALLVTDLRRAALVFAACVAVGAAANAWGVHAFADLTPLQRSNFLYFWFPNQACVFALGAVLYFVLRDGAEWLALLRRHATLLAAGCAVAFCALSTLPLGHFIGDGPGVPAFLAACPILFTFIIALSMGGRFVNGAAAFVGRLSFSAYLLHFAVLSGLAAFPALLHTGSTGYAAMAAYAGGLAAAVALTLAASALSFHVVEQPAVRLGKRLLAGRSYRATATAAA